MAWSYRCAEKTLRHVANSPHAQAAETNLAAAVLRCRDVCCGALAFRKARRWQGRLSIAFRRGRCSAAEPPAAFSLHGY
jgi:hypothetical protein